ncbi:MAG: adenylate/guanylate cyclase domain-containing protein [Alphaproteobacteria bacterium]|nr:adenylate/guanylate cyclase domain-containing protein [Alphaproteobacteria bacterium]
MRHTLMRVLRSPKVKALIGGNVIAAIIILLRGYGVLQPLELQIYDALVVAWVGHQPSSHVVLVGGTEADVEHFDWPLRDGDLATLLERIESWNPRVIGVDIYRDHPEPPGTERLAALLARNKNIVWAFKLKAHHSPGVPPPAILKGTPQAVLADTVPDSGNIVRRGLIFADDGVNNYPAIGMALALGYLDADGIRLGPGPDGDLQLGKALIAPLDDTRGPYVQLDSRGYQVLLDYRGGRDPFPFKSVGYVMHHDDAAPLVRGKAVIVGVAAVSVNDSFSTPFNSGFHNAEPIFGVALHAHLADQLIREALNGDPMLSGLPRAAEDLWIWFWAMAGTLLAMRVAATIPAVFGTGAGLITLTGIVYISFGNALLLPALPAAIGWIGSAGLANRIMHAASNRTRALLRRSFEHYLPPAVIAQMLEANTLPKLGGERRELTVLFTDVANFTTLSENVPPEFLSTLCNDYFDGVCGAIFEQGGMVNEFIGDAVLAFFNAPLEQPDHADRAVSAALAVEKFASRFSTEQKSRGVDFGHTRIGVHSGEAIVGNVGTRQRLKYSALGDMLNTGSRLEGLNKKIGSRICVSGETVARSKRHRFRPVGTFVVKGRHGGTEVFEPLRATDQESDRLARYEAAFRALEVEKPEAAELFAALRRDYPEDPCVCFHCHRLADGESGTTIVMTEK